MVREVLLSKLAVMGDSGTEKMNISFDRVWRYVIHCFSVEYINLVCHNQLVWSAYLVQIAPPPHPIFLYALLAAFLPNIHSFEL